MSLTVEALETQLRNLWMLDPDDAAKALLPFIERHIAADAKLWAALRTVEALGYTYHGATMWKPPLGKVPAYIAAGQQGAEDETPPLGLIAELVKAEIEYAGDYDYTQVSYKFTPDQLADFARRHATPQPPKPAGAVPLPEPSGYIRIKNGQYQIQVGGEEPHDRGNGHHGPWVHIFDTQTLRDYGDARAAEGRVSMRAASLWPSRWTVELHPNKANAFRIIHRDGRRTDYAGPKDADLKLMWELILDTLEESHT